jgi:hypothetical protein
MNKLSLALCIFISHSCITSAQDFDPSRIRKHIATLADDKMQGRATGTSSEKLAADYIIGEFKSLKLQPLGDGGSFTQAFEFKGGAHALGKLDTAYNVIGFLNNKAKTTVVIGAHYDHLGSEDGLGSSLDANPANKIHNGADDNASGVAGVIELARFFSTNKITEKSNFLFVCFSGEELGLLGSKYFTDHSPIDLTAIDFMINLDMVGRLNPETKKLMINGTGTSPVWEPLIKRLKRTALNVSTDSSGIGPSDQTSFYLRNIPAIHFFTGSHSDYHKPGDDIEKVNPSGEADILKLIADIVIALNDEPKLTFLKTRQRSQTSVSSFKVTMGIMPSYASDVKGLKVDGVTEGKPAAHAGIKTGDVIIKMGDQPVNDIYGYMDALGKFEKGQTVPVILKREGKEMTVSVTF